MTAEMYARHIMGDQWADVINGVRVSVPPNLSGGVRITRNYEGPIVRHFVAYHTAQKYQILARPKADREARDKSKLDTLLANDIIHRQRVNEVFGQALFWGAAHGHCPVHAQWRDDLSADPFEPVYNVGGPNAQAMRPGFVDIWCGDPWQTIYNDGALRHSVQWWAYGRVLPAQIVRDAFQHVQGIESLEGRTDMPSASRTQRIAAKWEHLTAHRHGSMAMVGGLHGEEMIALVCREIAPGVSRQYPQGALQIIALNGQADTDVDGMGGLRGNPVLLHSGPLPGGRFSAVRVYASTRGDDVWGQPYVANIDKAQTDLNQLLTNEIEFVRRFARPPLKTLAGSLVDDTVTTEDDAILEAIDPLGLQHMGYLYPPAAGAGIFDKAINRAEEYIFRESGWQAASRGESTSGDPAAKVVALARADDTIQGPIQEGVRNSLVELMQLCHALVRENLSLPWVVRNVSGEDMGHLAEPYIRASQLSDDAPDYIVVSGAGPTPENRAQQLLQMVTMIGADQQPVLPTEKMWKLWPDQTIAPPEIKAQAQREARAQKINYAIQQVAADLRAQMGPQADMQLFQAHAMITQEYPMLLDDPDDLHIETLSNLTQDEMEDSLVRRLATLRQQGYMQRLQMKQMQQAAMQPEMPPAKGAGPARQQQQAPRPAAPMGPSPIAGTPSSEAMRPETLASDVESLTQDAARGAVA